MANVFEYASVFQSELDKAAVEQATSGWMELNDKLVRYNGGAEVKIEPERVRLVLSDHGPGIPDVDLAMQEGYSTATERVRNLGFGAGMGLPNMKKYSDEMHIDTVLGRGTTVTMIINCPQQTA